MNDQPMPETGQDSGPCSKTSLELELDGEYYEDYDHLYLDTTAGAEEYLREIWNELGVGKNGYLTVNELYSVCEHIGMDTSEDVIEQLFDKLDNDRDGQISFVEFVDGLFRFANGPVESSTSVPPTSFSPRPFSPSASSPAHQKLSTSTLSDPSVYKPFDNQHQTTPTSNSAPPTSSCETFVKTTTNSSLYKTTLFTTPPATPSTAEVFFSSNDRLVDNCDGLNCDLPESTRQRQQQQDDHRAQQQHQQQQQPPRHISANIDSFISIPSEKDGYIKVSSLLKLWNNLGYSLRDGERLLKDFRLQSSKQFVNVVDFWNILEDSLYRHCVDNEHAQICLLTIVHELSQLKINLEYAIQKCEQLQNNLDEANARAELLASEVDEQHLRLEKSFADQLLIVDKKYREKIKNREKEIGKEKEGILAKTKTLRNEAEKQCAEFEEQINKLQECVKFLEKDKQRTESENEQLRATIIQLEENAVSLRQQISNTIQLENKIIELESMASLIDTQKCQTLVSEIDRLKEQNKTLQDRNDELLIEKDRIRQQLARYESAFLSYPGGNYHQTIPPESDMMPGTVPVYSHSSSIVSDGSTPQSQHWNRTQKRKRRRMRRKARIQLQQQLLNDTEQSRIDAEPFHSESTTQILSTAAGKDHYSGCDNHHPQASIQLIDSGMHPVSSTPISDSILNEHDCDHCQQDDIKMSTFSLSDCSTIDTVAESPDLQYKGPHSSSSMIQSSESFSSCSRASNLNDHKRQRIFSNPSQTESMLDYSYEDEAFAPDDIYYEADENLDFDVDDPQTIVDNHKVEQHSFDVDDDDDDDDEDDDDDGNDENDHFRYMTQEKYYYTPQASSERNHYKNRNKSGVHHFRRPLHHSASLSEEIEWAKNKEAFEQESKDYEIIKETVETIFTNGIRASSRSNDNSPNTSSVETNDTIAHDNRIGSDGDNNNNPFDVAIEDGLNLIKNAISSALINISPIRLDNSSEVSNISSTSSSSTAKTKEPKFSQNKLTSSEIVKSFIRYLRRQPADNDHGNLSENNDDASSSNSNHSADDNRVIVSNRIFDQNNNPNGIAEPVAPSIAEN